MVEGGVVDKKDILDAFKKVRDSHTEDQYEERKNNLFEASENVLVRPGGAKESVSFHNYFLRNWHPVRDMWVLHYRNKLPI